MQRLARTRPTATTAAEDLGEASRQLLEQSFNDGKFDLADQLIAADAVNHDPAEPAELVRSVDPRCSNAR